LLLISTLKLKLNSKCNPLPRISTAFQKDFYNVLNDITDPSPSMQICLYFTSIHSRHHSGFMGTITTCAAKFILVLGDI